MEKKFEVSEFALEAVRHFEFSGTLINVRPFGNGHINDTYLAEYDIFGMGQVKVIIQRMNRNVFKQPEELMENIVNVTEFLKKKIENFLKKRLTFHLKRHRIQTSSNQLYTKTDEKEK